MLGEWRSDQVQIGTANSDWALALVKLSVRLIGCDLRFAAIRGASVLQRRETGPWAFSRHGVMSTH